MKLVVLAIVAVVAQADPLGHGAATVGDLHVRWETRVEPGSPALRGETGNATRVDKGVVKRIVANYDNSTYFGYDLVMETIAEGRFRLRFSPLSTPPDALGELFSKRRQWSLLPLPNGSPTMTVRSGETVALDLFVNRTTGQKVTDYVSVTSTKEPFQVHVQGSGGGMTIMAPRVTIDGQATFRSQAGVLGPKIWMDIPGHGSFVISVAPLSGLGASRMGQVSGDRLTWRAEGHEYTIVSIIPITSESRALHVYAIPRAVEQFVMGSGEFNRAP